MSAMDECRHELIELSLRHIKASKAKKLTTEHIIECIMDAMDILDLDESCEIDDQLIQEVELKSKQRVLDGEEQMLRRANENYDRIVSQPIAITSASSKSSDDKWTSYTSSYEKKKSEWELIQNKIELLHTRLEEALCNK